MITNKRVEEQELPQPLVSIIIPSYNREKLIGETLDSVLAQTYQHWECIVVDDGSTDGTMKVVSKYVNADSRIKLYKRDREPKGASVCRNIGAMEIAKGDYLIFLDSDDLLIPSCLKDRVKLIGENQNMDFISFRTGTFSERIGDKDSAINLDISTNPLYSFIRHKAPWTIMGPIWNRNSISRLGGFDERFLRFQDVELHTRALLLDYNYKVLDKRPYDNYYRNQITAKKVGSLYKSVLLSACLYIDQVLKHSNGRKDIHIIKDNLLLLAIFIYRVYIIQNTNCKELHSFWKKVFERELLRTFKQMIIFSFLRFVISSRLIKIRGFKRMTWSLSENIVHDINLIHDKLA